MHSLNMKKLNMIIKVSVFIKNAYKKKLEINIKFHLRVLCKFYLENTILIRYLENTIKYDITTIS